MPTTGEPTSRCPMASAQIPAWLVSPTERGSAAHLWPLSRRTAQSLYSIVDLWHYHCQVPPVGGSLLPSGDKARPLLEVRLTDLHLYPEPSAIPRTRNHPQSEIKPESKACGKSRRFHGDFPTIPRNAKTLTPLGIDHLRPPLQRLLPLWRSRQQFRVQR